MNSEKLKELEQTILGAPKAEEHPAMTSEPPIGPPAPGMGRRYVPVLTDSLNDDVSIGLPNTFGENPQYWNPRTTRVVKSDYLGPIGDQHMHRVLIEAPEDDLLENHLAHVEEYGTHAPSDPEWVERWETHPEDVPGGAHPIHQAMQGIKDEIFGPAHGDPINWERVGHHMDTIPDSVMKQNLDAEIENLRDLQMSGEDMGSSAHSTHQAIDDLAAEHGLPMAKDPSMF